MFIGNDNLKKLLESCEETFRQTKDNFQIKAKC